MSRKYGVPFIAYKCLFCDGWHVAKDAEIIADKTRVDGWEIPIRKAVEPRPLNIDAIEVTNVPDLHYGDKRDQAWPSGQTLQRIYV